MNNFVSLDTGKTFVSLGSLYLKGNISLDELDGALGHMQIATLSSEASFSDQLAFWRRQVARRLDIWRVEPAPLTEADFREWLQTQIDKAAPDSNANGPYP